MTKHCFVFFLFNLLGLDLLFAQNRVVMPPSPNPSALAKYVDRPVSYYTGIPEIKIPLWSVNLKNYTLPIELNYHGGGVKIEEEASFVGLSWSLSAGGVVTRSVRDIPDDYNKGEVIKNYEDRLLDPSDNYEHPRIGRFWSGKYETLRDFNFASTDKSYIISNLQSAKANYGTAFGSLQGNNDVEPDVFYFSFGNKSGKFVFDVDGNVQTALQTPYQDVVISHTLNARGEISSFTIVDNDGTEYLFDKIERIERIGGSASDQIWARQPGLAAAPESQTIIKTVYNSSWYLSQLKTMYGETISFSYEDEESFQLDRPSSSSITGKYNSGLTYSGVYANNAGSSESGTKKRLTKIETYKETINFLSTHLRQDLYKPSYALTSVEIINRSTGSRIKSYTLDQSYFQSPLAEPFNGLYTNLFPVLESDKSSYYKRLRLDKVWEKGADDSGNPPYIFDYDNSNQLPHRFSYQQDLWGFFNGASSNTNLYPTLYVYPQFSGSDRFRVYTPCYAYSALDNYTLPGGNRLPNANAMKVGSLKSITYPTGGRTDFVFKPNTFYYDQCTYTGGGLRIDSIKNYSTVLSTIPSTTRVYTYSDPNGLSSGRITSLPVFAHQTFIQTMYYDYSQAALGTTNGSLVGYQSVTESFENNGVNNGSVRYDYSMPALYGEPSDAEYNLYRISQVKWTDNVTVNTWGADGYQGFLDYKNNYHLLPNTSPFPPNPEYDWNRGKLRKESYFNSSGTLIKEVNNDYKIYSAAQWKGRKNVYGLVYNFIGYSVENHQYSIVYSKYEHLANRANVLNTSTVKNYSPANGLLTSTVKYKYSEAGHMNPIEVTTDLSDGSSKIEKSLFPHDYSDETPLPLEILAMKNRNISASPIESIVYIQRANEKKAISGEINKYVLSGNNYILPEKHYSLEPDAPLTNFNESSTYFEDFRMDSRYKEDFSYDLYDGNGNLSQSKEKEQLVKSYIWGSSRSHPLVEVTNAQLTDVAYAGFEGEINGGWGGIEILPIDFYSGGYRGKSSYDLGLAQQPLTKSGLSTSKKYELSLWTTNPVGTIVKVNNQQVNGVSNVTDGIYKYVKYQIAGGSSVSISGVSNIDEVKLYPTDASMITCTYDPLIGLLDITDAKGQTTYYEYDSFQRLKTVKDQDGKILKNYTYHYKTQN